MRAVAPRRRPRICACRRTLGDQPVVRRQRCGAPHGRRIERCLQSVHAPLEPLDLGDPARVGDRLPRACRGGNAQRRRGGGHHSALERVELAERTAVVLDT